jgi:hypothetical protein
MSDGRFAPFKDVADPAKPTLLLVFVIRMFGNDNPVMIRAVKGEARVQGGWDRRGETVHRRFHLRRRIAPRYLRQKEQQG